MRQTIARLMLEANIATRALRLWEDGYTAEKWETWEDTYTMTSPAGDRYTVILDGDGSKPSCSCPCYKENKICKHWLAVHSEAARLQTMCDEHDAAEYGRFATISDALDHGVRF